jgi:Xaa-Pro aminopeptidase
MFLLDSGGQYLTGTTDVTRTLHLGRASAHHKRCYTRVLQSHLQLHNVRFPKGITG